MSCTSDLEQWSRRYIYNKSIMFSAVTQACSLVTSTDFIFLYSLCKILEINEFSQKLHIKAADSVPFIQIDIHSCKYAFLQLILLSTSCINIEWSCASNGISCHINGSKAQYVQHGILNKRQEVKNV